MADFSHTQAIEQIRKAEAAFVPEEIDDWSLEGVEGFVVRVKDILRHTEVSESVLSPRG